MKSGRAYHDHVRAFCANSSRKDTSLIREPQRNRQEPGFLSSKATESTHSVSSHSETPSPSAATPNTILNVGFISFSHRDSTLSTSNGDDSRESPEVDSPACSNNVSTALCLFDESWDYPGEWKRRVSCAPRKRSTEERNIALMKIQSREDKEEEKRKGVSTELALPFSDPWTIKKQLNRSDLGDLSRLLLPSSLVQDHILAYLPEDDASRIAQGQGLSISVLDHDTWSLHQLCLKRWKSSGSYVLIGNWRRDFVCRRRLKEDDTIGLFWDRFASRFHFCVLRRAAANPQRPN